MGGPCSLSPGLEDQKGPRTVGNTLGHCSGGYLMLWSPKYHQIHGTERLAGMLRRFEYQMVRAEYHARLLFFETMPMSTWRCASKKPWVRWVPCEISGAKHHASEPSIFEGEGLVRIQRNILPAVLLVNFRRHRCFLPRQTNSWPWIFFTLDLH